MLRREDLFPLPEQVVNHTNNNGHVDMLGLLRTSEVVFAVSEQASQRKKELLEANRLRRRLDQRDFLRKQQERFNLRRVSR